MTKQILLLLKFVCSEVSHDSEHSESEFCYPGVLLDAELLQSFYSRLLFPLLSTFYPKINVFN